MLLVDDEEDVEYIVVARRLGKLSYKVEAVFGIHGRGRDSHIHVAVAVESYGVECVVIKSVHPLDVRLVFRGYGCSANLVRRHDNVCYLEFVFGDTTNKSVPLNLCLKAGDESSHFNPRNRREIQHRNAVIRLKRERALDINAAIALQTAEVASEFCADLFDDVFYIVVGHINLLSHLLRLLP